LQTLVKKFIPKPRQQHLMCYNTEMNLLSPSVIKTLLNKYEAKPSKGLGQNFLIDENILNKIIESADIPARNASLARNASRSDASGHSDAGGKPSDTILEVGPGIGTLTQALATRLRQGYGEAKKEAGRVIAVEKDKTMCLILKETLKDFKNVKIIQGDILKFDDFTLKIKNYKVVANIPYYLTSPLIRKFLESDDPPSEMILMLQKEVAQRICSKPPDMSLLAVSVQFYAEPKIVSYVSKNCFWPSPKIDSAIIKIVPRRGQTSRPTGGLTSPDLFFKIVRAGFAHPRKQLANNLLALGQTEGSKTLKLEREKVEAWLLKNNLKPNQRAETLSIEDWKNLTKTSLLIT